MASVLKKVLKYIAGIKTYIQIKMFAFRHDKNKICFLISHELTQTGAPIVLMHTAEVLQKAGYFPIILSISDGPMRRFGKEHGIPVYVTYDQQAIYRYLSSVHCKLFLVNSIVAFKWIDKLKENRAPVYWWIHEGELYINRYKNEFDRVYSKRITLWTVSNWCISCFQKVGTDISNYTAFPYGIPNQYLNLAKQFEAKKDNGKFTIITVGSITERKNQLQLIKALKCLPDAIQRNIEFRIIGTGVGEYFSQVQREAKVNRWINMVGQIPSKQMHKEYLIADLVVCTSVDDPCPVFITEAMMFHRRVLVSCNTGQANSIRSISQDLVYDINDSGDLIKKVMKAFSERNTQRYIEDEYQLYLKHFDIDVFAKNLLNNIEGVCNDKQ